jgi:NADH:ubiquinone oxidoreductase subunit B-like Fe-S oxidoreductase
MTSTYDWRRLGVGRLVDSPSQADVLLVGGWINDSRCEEIKAAYSEMVGAKSVIAVGSCVLSGSPYAPGASKTILASQILPVDVFVPGCPPRPEALLEAFHLLKQKRRPSKDQDKIIYEALRGPSRP